MGGHLGALAHFEESGVGPRPVLLLWSSAVRARDVGGGAAVVAPGNGGGRRRRRRRRDSAGGWWVWGPGPLRNGLVTPLLSPGPGRGTALKAKEGMGWPSACLLGPGLVSGGGEEPGRCGPWRETWAWGGRRGLQRVWSQGKGLVGCVTVPFRSRGSIITLGTRMRADPRSCWEQPLHTGLGSSQGIGLYTPQESGIHRVRQKWGARPALLRLRSLWR